MKFILIFALLFSLQSFADDAEEQAMYQRSLTSSPGGGLTDAVEQKAFPPRTVVIPKLQSTAGKSAQSGLEGAGTQCTSRGRLARGACLTSMNPKIATAASGITALLAAMDMTKGQKESCEKFGSAMDIAKTAVTAYTAACGAARMACTSSCQKLLHTVASAKSSLAAAKAAAQASCSSSGTQCEQVPLITADEASLDTVRMDLTTAEPYNEGLIVQCDKYKLKIAAGVAGIYQIVQSAKGGDKCASQIAENNPNASTGLDCSKPENAQVIECLCRANPTLSGCVGGGSGSNNNNDPYQMLTGGPLPRSEGEDGSGNIDLSSAPAADSSPFAGSGGSGAGGALGGSGGGGGAGGLPLSGTGKAADGGGVAAKPLNKNILNGYEGGGGGGGGGYSDNGYADQFKPFMPGGEKDPSRDPASMKFAGGQVTGNGGKSNWEKVRDRYQANKPSLIVGGP